MKSVISAFLYAGIFIFGVVAAAVFLFILTLIFPSERESITSFLPVGSLGLGVVLAILRRNKIRKKRQVATEVSAPERIEISNSSDSNKQAGRRTGDHNFRRGRVWIIGLATLVFAYIIVYNVEAPTVAAKARLTVLSNIASHYIVDETIVPWNIVVSGSATVPVFVSSPSNPSASGMIPVNIIGNCVFQRCSVSVRGIDIIRYQ